jgi:hypothetical protein
MPEPDAIRAWLEAAMAACGPILTYTVQPGMLQVHVGRALWAGPGDTTPWVRYIAAHRPPVPVVLLGVPPAPVLPPPRPRAPQPPPAQHRPRRGRPRPPASWTDTGRGDLAPDTGPWSVAVARHHAAAIQRWEHDTAPRPVPTRVRATRTDRTIYSPLFDGVIEPDPLDVQRRWWRRRPVPA